MNATTVVKIVAVSVATYTLTSKVLARSEKNRQAKIVKAENRRMSDEKLAADRVHPLDLFVKN